MTRFLQTTILLSLILACGQSTAEEKAGAKKPDAAKQEKPAHPQIPGGQLHKVVDLKPVDKPKK